MWGCNEADYPARSRAEGSQWITEGDREMRCENCKETLEGYRINPDTLETNPLTDIVNKVWHCRNKECKNYSSSEVNKRNWVKNNE